MMRQLICLMVVMGLGIIAPCHATMAIVQQKKTSVKSRNKRSTSRATQSARSTQRGPKSETVLEIDALPPLSGNQDGTAMPQVFDGICKECLYNPGMCSACNGSGKMRKVTVEHGTQYVDCDKCNGTRICPVCHGQSQVSRAQTPSLATMTQPPATTFASPVYTPPASVSSSASIVSLTSSPHWKDHTTRGTAQELMRYMRSLQTDDGTIIMPKNRKMDKDDFGVYLYFVQPASGAPRELRLRIQYYANSPQNFSDVRFDVGGNVFTYHVNNPQRGRVGKYYWELCDQSVTNADRAMLYALQSSLWTRLFFVGKINDLRHLTDEELRDFERVINLYRLNGGVF